MGEDVKAEGGSGGDLGEEAGEAGVGSSICSERCSSGDSGRMGPRDPTSATKQGSFLLLLLRPLAGQPQSHTPRENSSLCLATAASFTLTGGTPPLTTFWKTDFPGSFHSPF